ncbi:hypothetical protein DLM78_14240 [Leptospira stimsonii]|uniref:Uncharacterized protein n=1 Tax=Leptospira stimsonii TaxID=2202203 RepID=A0A8B3CNB6_9LEPT|nr:hypothetical protein DLM78_14240 [Leptospira stimsonii]
MVEAGPRENSGDFSLSENTNFASRKRFLQELLQYVGLGKNVSFPKFFLKFRKVFLVLKGNRRVFKNGFAKVSRTRFLRIKTGISQ